MSKSNDNLTKTDKDYKSNQPYGSVKEFFTNQIDQ